MADLTHLPKKKEFNEPGIKKNVYIGDVSLMTTVAAAVNPPVIPGDEALIADSHLFGVGDGFLKLYTTLDTGELTAETIGDLDSRAIAPKLEMFHPGIYEEALEFARNAQICDWIILVEQLNGKYVQMGIEGLEMSISHALGSGKVSGGGKGITFTAEGFSPIFIYEGTITEKV